MKAFFVSHDLKVSCMYIEKARVHVIEHAISNPASLLGPDLDSAVYLSLLPFISQFQFFLLEGICI